ncbi:uncharacterized protein LOC114321543 isoform X3 [Camellia sinensis]|uniref:uncharacterized protein LOC114321543 isoform X3 n=1 Tax=Camellia sinensis TaxID=4442 RepID=UPI001035F924|nr:uncharacterized protein LOC114321543 isoform X3 [Camellia sinensis]
MGAASFRWILQLHKDVPKAAKLYSEGLDFSINVCTLRWAELQSGSLKLALLHSPRLQQSGVSTDTWWASMSPPEGSNFAFRESDERIVVFMKKLENNKK